MKADSIKPQRRWFQFSIKTVLILTLVVAAFLAGKVPEQRRAREAEMRARNEAERAMMAERDARAIAEKSMQQAKMAVAALQQARVAQQRLAAERASSKEDPDE